MDMAECFPMPGNRTIHSIVMSEVEYANDTPLPPNSLNAALVLSRKPHAHIISVDASGAKSSPGFASIFLAKNVLGRNEIGTIVDDEEVFASEFVSCIGQVFGVAVADTQ